MKQPRNHVLFGFDRDIELIGNFMRASFVRADIDRVIIEKCRRSGGEKGLKDGPADKGQESKRNVVSPANVNEAQDKPMTAPSDYALLYLGACKGSKH